MYPERLQKFMEQIHTKVSKRSRSAGSSRPSADGKDFDVRLGADAQSWSVDMVDEHYYKESGMVP